MHILLIMSNSDSGHSNISDNKANDNSVLSVSQLTESIKTLILSKFSRAIKVEGEVSNVKISGTSLYATLKDNSASISIVLWNNTSKCKIKNGDNVVVTGFMGCYSKQGSYQIRVIKIEAKGVGNLHEKYENLKKTFEKKGYFSKKRILPNKINRIGILTSVEGAVLQDILHVLRSKFYSGEVHIKNCSVQGNQCPESVKNGIVFFNKLHKTKPFDILLIARGGGSTEDLMGYSSTEVVKAIYESPIITISAVGHETDTMLSDYAADYRAPTPSIAGEIITTTQNSRRELLNKSIDNITHIESYILNKINNQIDRLVYSSKLIEAHNPIKIIESELIRLQQCEKNIEEDIISKCNEFLHKLEKLKNKNMSHNVNKTLSYGYAVIVNEENDIVSDTKTMKKLVGSKQKLKIIFADGEVDMNSLLYSDGRSKKNKTD